MPRMTARVAYAVLKALWILGTAAALIPAAPWEASARVDRVVVAPTSPSVVAFAHWYIAEPLGYYAQEQLQVDIQIGSAGSIDAALLAGRLDFGEVSATQAIPRAQSTDALKYFMLTGMYPFRVFAIAGGPYCTAEALVGQTIGVPEPSDVSITHFLMQAAGVGPDRYRTLPVGGRAPAAIALREGRIQAFMGTHVDQMFVENAGLEVCRVPTGDTSAYYNVGLMTTVSAIRGRPDLVVRVGRAVAKASVWRFENPEATIGLLARVRPEAVQDRAFNLRLLHASNDVNRAAYEVRGRMRGEVWQAMVDAYARMGLIRSRYDVSKLYTNEFLEAIWDFDIEAVRRAARSYR